MTYFQKPLFCVESIRSRDPLAEFDFFGDEVTTPTLAQQGSEITEFSPSDGWLNTNIIPFLLWSHIDSPFKVDQGSFYYTWETTVKTFKYVEGGPDREVTEVVWNTSSYIFKIFKCIGTVAESNRKHGFLDSTLPTRFRQTYIIFLNYFRLGTCYYTSFGVFIIYWKYQCFCPAVFLIVAQHCPKA